MTKLIENQIDENQMMEKELEELNGGGCFCILGSGNVNGADEDDNENIVF